MPRPLASTSWRRVDDEIARVTADAAYETVAFYDAAGMRDATVVVPPSKTARVSRRRPRSRARDRTITDVRTLGRRRWKKEAGSQLQARVENAFFRYKSILGDRLRARSRGGRVAESVVACHVPEPDDRARSATVVQYGSVTCLWVGIVDGQFRVSSSPRGLLPRGPHQNRTRRFPPSGSSADVAHGDAPRFAHESEARAEDIVPITQRTSARGPLPFEFLVT